MGWEETGGEGEKEQQEQRRRASAARPHHLSQTMCCCPDPGNRQQPFSRTEDRVAPAHQPLCPAHLECWDVYGAGVGGGGCSALLQSENDRMIKATAAIQH